MTAPMLGHLRPFVHRFQLGEFEVTTILDGAQIRPAISPPFGVNQSAEAIAAHAKANLLPADKFENTYTPTIAPPGRYLDRLLLPAFSGRKGDIRLQCRPPQDPN